MSQSPEKKEKDPLSQKNFNATTYLCSIFGDASFASLSATHEPAIRAALDAEDKALRKLVLERLDVFVQVKDAIDYVYSKDQHLFSGQAIGQLEEEYRTVRQACEATAGTIFAQSKRGKRISAERAVLAKVGPVARTPGEIIDFVKMKEWEPAAQRLQLACNFQRTQRRALRARLVTDRATQVVAEPAAGGGTTQRTGSTEGSQPSSRSTSPIPGADESTTSTVLAPVPSSGSFAFTEETSILAASKSGRGSHAGGTQVSTNFSSAWLAAVIRSGHFLTEALLADAAKSIIPLPLRLSVDRSGGEVNAGSFAEERLGLAIGVLGHVSRLYRERLKLQWLSTMGRPGASRHPLFLDSNVEGGRPSSSSAADPLETLLNEDDAAEKDAAETAAAPKKFRHQHPFLYYCELVDREIWTHLKNASDHTLLGTVFEGLSEQFHPQQQSSSSSSCGSSSKRQFVLDALLANDGSVDTQLRGLCACDTPDLDPLPASVQSLPSIANAAVSSILSLARRIGEVAMCVSPNCPAAHGEQITLESAASMVASIRRQAEVHFTTAVADWWPRIEAALQSGGVLDQGVISAAYVPAASSEEDEAPDEDAPVTQGHGGAAADELLEESAGVSEEVPEVVVFARAGHRLLPANSKFTLKPPATSSSTMEAPLFETLHQIALNWSYSFTKLNLGLMCITMELGLVRLLSVSRLHRLQSVREQSTLDRVTSQTPVGTNPAATVALETALFRKVCDTWVAAASTTATAMSQIETSSVPRAGQSFTEFLNKQLVGKLCRLVIRGLGQAGQIQVFSTLLPFSQGNLNPDVLSMSPISLIRSRCHTVTGWRQRATSEQRILAPDAVVSALDLVCAKARLNHQTKSSVLPVAVAVLCAAVVARGASLAATFEKLLPALSSSDPLCEALSDILLATIDVLFARASVAFRGGELEPEGTAVGKKKDIAAVSPYDILDAILGTSTSSRATAAQQLFPVGGEQQLEHTAGSVRVAAHQKASQAILTILTPLSRLETAFIDITAISSLDGSVVNLVADNYGAAMAFSAPIGDRLAHSSSSTTNPGGVFSQFDAGGYSDVDPARSQCGTLFDGKINSRLLARVDQRKRFFKDSVLPKLADVSQLATRTVTKHVMENYSAEAATAVITAGFVFPGFSWQSPPPLLGFLGMDGKGSSSTISSAVPATPTTTAAAAAAAGTDKKFQRLGKAATAPAAAGPKTSLAQVSDELIQRQQQKVQALLGSPLSVRPYLSRVVMILASCVACFQAVFSGVKSKEVYIKTQTSLLLGQIATQFAFAVNDVLDTYKPSTAFRQFGTPLLQVEAQALLSVAKQVFATEAIDTIKGRVLPVLAGCLSAEAGGTSVAFHEGTPTSLNTVSSVSGDVTGLHRDAAVSEFINQHAAILDAIVAAVSGKLTTQNERAAALLKRKHQVEERTAAALQLDPAALAKRLAAGFDKEAAERAALLSAPPPTQQETVAKPKTKATKKVVKKSKQQAGDPQQQGSPTDQVNAKAVEQPQQEVSLAMQVTAAFMSRMQKS